MSFHFQTVLSTREFKACCCVSDKCDLPAGCKIQDYIVQENFDHNMVNSAAKLLVIKLRF